MARSGRGGSHGVWDWRSPDEWPLRTALNSGSRPAGPARSYLRCAMASSWAAATVAVRTPEYRHVGAIYRWSGRATTRPRLAARRPMPPKELQRVAPPLMTPIRMDDVEHEDQSCPFLERSPTGPVRKEPVREVREREVDLLEPRWHFENDGAVGASADHPKCFKHERWIFLPTHQSTQRFARLCRHPLRMPPHAVVRPAQRNIRPPMPSAGLRRRGGPGGAD